mgnify:CR=1 FL=1
MAVLTFLTDENKALGLIGNSFLAGVNNVNDGSNPPESKLTFPWVIDKATTWLDYRCKIEVYLDPGMVLHKPLPQSKGAPDSLTTAFIDDTDLDTNTKGVNFKSHGGYKDIVQKMATSQYTFVLKGHGLRAGYQIPIPSIKKIAGVSPTPLRQWVSTPEIVANMGGIPLFFAQWELWYMVTLPPTSDQTPPANVALHIRGDQQIPNSIPTPFTRPDYNAVNAAPVTKPITQTQGAVTPGG